MVTAKLADRSSATVFLAALLPLGPFLIDGRLQLWAGDLIADRAAVS